MSNLVPDISLIFILASYINSFKDSLNKELVLL
jgi:hypothetical protein